jgi:hypothetical protein
MLTKSDLQSFLQCRRKIWLEKHRTDLLPPEDSGLSRRAMDGVIVGSRAREDLRVEYIWPRVEGGDKKIAAEHALGLLRAAPLTPGVEVPLESGGLYARADALVPKNDAYVLRETKASTFPLKSDKVTPDAPKGTHLDDVAIQTWVAEKMGLSIAAVELNLLNSRWRYPGGGDYRGLFRQLDVTTTIADRKAKVSEWLEQARVVVTGAMPSVTTGSHCNDPYECPFQEHCEGIGERRMEHPIELLPGAAGKALARRLKAEKGYQSILDPKPEDFEGKHAPLYRRMQEAHEAGSGVLEVGVATRIAGLAYPRYYFDFEGIDFPVPQWKGFRPYEHAPFQWSCHIEHEPGKFTHAEFLDLTGEDPSLPCIEEMRQVIDPYDLGPIIVYSATYERGRLQDLATRHPEHAELMEKYIERLVDLLPLVQDHFYHPSMQGSFSIKKVLPVVAPDLDYRGLREIQEGTAAQVAYLLATQERATSPARKAELETRLRAYCRQDTWAMVELAYFLASAGRPNRPDPILR